MRDILFAVVCTYRLLLNGPRGGENFFINFTLSTSAGLMVRTSLRPTVVMTLLRIVGVLILLTTVTKLITNTYLIIYLKYWFNLKNY